MKKTSILLLLCVSSFLSAQTRIGLTGGINFSGITSDNSVMPDFDNKSSLSAGAVLDFVVSDKWHLQFEPQYIEKGAVLNIPGLIMPSFNIRLTYIELPLLLKYTTGKVFKPYLIAGPSLAINLSSEMALDLFGFEIAADTKNMTKDINFGLSMGGGFNYETENISFFVEGRYTYSLDDFTKSGFVSAEIGGFSFTQKLENNFNLKSSGFQLLIGFLLPINE